MIRNKRRFHQQALVEVKILENLRQKVSENVVNSDERASLWAELIYDKPPTQVILVDKNRLLKSH